MTIDEFLAELKLCVPQHVWSVTEKWGLRADDDRTGECFCPITALAYWRDGKVYRIDDADYAADHLGLSEIDAEYIIDAADCPQRVSRKIVSKLYRATIRKNKNIKPFANGEERAGNE